MPRCGKRLLHFLKRSISNGYGNKRTVAENWRMIKHFWIRQPWTISQKKKASKKVSLPWVTKNIKALIRKKDRTHSMFKKTNNPRLEKKWKDERRQVKREIEKAHSDHLNNLIGDVSKDSKPFWKYISNQKADKQDIPPLLKKDNSIAESDKR